MNIWSQSDFAAYLYICGGACLCPPGLLNRSSPAWILAAPDAVPASCNKAHEHIPLAPLTSPWEPSIIWRPLLKPVPHPVLGDISGNGTHPLGPPGQRPEHPSPSLSPNLDVNMHAVGQSCWCDDHSARFSSFPCQDQRPRSGSHISYLGLPVNEDGVRPL